MTRGGGRAIAAPLLLVGLRRPFAAPDVAAAPWIRVAPPATPAVVTADTAVPIHAPFRSAAVLGAGVMGAQIAAHLANAGLRVELLDLAGPQTPKNSVVEQLFARARALRPPPFFTEDAAAAVRLGNFDEHWDRVGDVDWVIEAVVEKLEVKRQVTARLEATLHRDAVASTNTSGLPIRDIAAGRGAAFRRRFLGTHFFNPPRYMKLLELVPTADTDRGVLERVGAFARVHLGKGCVVAKDTPNFIANRIGVYALLQAIRFAAEHGYSFEEVDALTGPLIGHAKSATFRTCDVVGIDTLVYVAQSLHAAVPHDESRAAFEVPPVLQALLAAGALGQKAKRGFYQRQGKDILSFDPARAAYVAARPLDLAEVEAIRRAGDLAARLRALWADEHRAGRFFRATTRELLGYAARRIPEITDDPADLDRALRWGFGWEMGPFEIWDALGFDSVLQDLRRHGSAVPVWVEEMARQGAPGFYRDDGPSRAVWLPARGYAPQPHAADEIELSRLARRPGGTAWAGDQAALLDLGDGVACFEFRSKANTLTTGVMAALVECIDLVERGPWRGMVIGNGAEHFSPGANLVEMATAAQAGEFAAIDAIIARFQQTVQRVHRAAKPVVVATAGRVLGGACELLLACPHPVAAAESYIGLVELGAGLIPAGGGTMRMAAWAADRAAAHEPSLVQPFVQRAFQTVARATVATSAHNAQQLGLLGANATIVRHADRRLSVAKQEVLRLAAEGWLPPGVRSIWVVGEAGRSALEDGARQLLQGGLVDDYTAFVAGRLAWVLTGGALSAPASVSEQYLLDLEREAFVALLRQEGTQPRIAAIVGRGRK